MRVNVLRIDLSRKEFRFLAAERDPDWGKPMKEYPHYPIRVTRETPEEFLKRKRSEGLDMIGAINATGWAPWKRENGRFYRYACRMGLVISEGVVIEYPHRKPPFPVFLITKEGQAGIRMMDPEEDLSGIRLAVTGNAVILHDGKVCRQRLKTEAAPRTVCGLSEDKRFLYWMTIDGRFPLISEGATVEETGMILRSFGAFSAINMDGGGSTMMVLCPEGKPRRVMKVNTSYYRRKVACSLGFYRIKEKK